ncbi:sigma factor-like helix-turn-helix DNA-binding protein [Petrotoga sp. DB-2]
MYFNKHKSQRAIAKEMGIHRATVKRAIKQGR